MAQRPPQRTLIDLFELGGELAARQAAADADIDFDIDVDLEEEGTPHACEVLMEESPRGVRSEAWRRARAWLADERAEESSRETPR